MKKNELFHQKKSNKKVIKNIFYFTKKLKIELKTGSGRLYLF
jgi:hypothetical protein